MPADTSPTPIKAVLFDYGLVLSGPPDPLAWQRMKDIFSASDEDFHAAYWAPRHDYDRGTLNGNTYWRRVSTILGHALSDQELAQLIEADIDLWTQPNQAMIDWAAQLQSAGVKTGILSNLGDAMERGILERFAWLTDFTHHTFSHRLLMAKPEPSIYAYAVKGLGTAPEEVLFIDDRADNVAAAQQAGMQAIQYTVHQNFLEAMHERGLDWLLGPLPEGEQSVSPDRQ